MEEEIDESTVFYSSQLENLPVSCDTVRKEMQCNSVLSQVMGIVLQGIHYFFKENEWSHTEKETKN